MEMKKTILLLLFFSITHLQAQEPENHSKYSRYITPEFLYGKTVEPNDSFPSIKAQTGYFLSFGSNNEGSEQEWAYRLKYPRTGFSVGVTDFRNSEFVGQAFSAETFLEFGFLRKRQQDLKMNAGIGVSYFNKKYDEITNPFNRGVTTDLTWTFRLFLYYEFLKHKNITMRLGAGYRHQSNGHTKLPNQGFNSFLASVSAQINYGKRTNEPLRDNAIKPIFKKNSQDYVSIRTGIGQQAFATAFNTKKEVYTVALEAGRIYNKTLKLGGGIHYRVYEHYYDYINNNESLVQDGREFENYGENPWYNASSLGIFAKCEVLLNHVAIEAELGYNIFKPGYDIDWRLNNGWRVVPREIPKESRIVLGEYNTKYKLKKRIASRLGLKYYAFATDLAPQHNFFVGLTINSNLGQADFTELNIGYVHAFNFKQKG